MVVLGLGSNLGDRRAFLRQAVRLLHREPGTRVIEISPVYESEAMLLPGSSTEWSKPYLNCAVRIDTALEPLTLLDRLKALERRIGRQERGRWAPREIDMDILVWDGLQLQSERLTLPHPGLAARPFALLPLDDLLAGAEHAWRGRAAEWKRLPPAERPFAAANRGFLYAELAGIVNVTPDSFSGDGSVNCDTAAESAGARAAAGARVIDVGAESTRPGAAQISAEQEWARLEPLLPQLVRLLKALAEAPLISVDTRHAQTAEKALALGVDWINDVGGQADPDMRAVLASASAKVVVMHSLGVPPLREQVLPRAADPLTAIAEWARGRLAELEEAGIEPGRVILDPGIGFGKTAWQNMQIIEEAQRLHELGVELLIGHSRKSFMESFTGLPPAERDPESAVISVELARRGVDYLRVHDVALNRRTLAAAGAVDGAARWSWSRM